MSNKAKGLLVGILCSLVPVVIWVLLAVYAEIFVGWIGALMGILFILPYQKLCPEDKSKVPYVIGAILIIVEVIAAEFITIAIIAGTYGVDLAVIFSYPEITEAMLFDILIGLLLSFVAFGIYIYSATRKSRQTEIRQRTNTSNMSTANSGTPETNYFVPGENISEDGYAASQPNEAPFESDGDNKE